MEQVFFDLHGFQAVEVSVVPGEVGVCVAQARHQGLAAAVDDLDALAGQVSGAGADVGDALIGDQYFAQEWLGSGAVEDVDVGEEGFRHDFVVLILKWRWWSGCYGALRICMVTVCWRRDWQPGLGLLHAQVFLLPDVRVALVRKSRTAAATKSGASGTVQWPVPGATRSSALPSSAAMASLEAGVLTLSSLPVRSRTLDWIVVRSGLVAFARASQAWAYASGSWPRSSSRTKGRRAGSRLLRSRRLRRWRRCRPRQPCLSPHEGGAGPGGVLGGLGLFAYRAEQYDFLDQVRARRCQLLDDEGSHRVPDEVRAAGGGLGFDDQGQFGGQGFQAQFPGPG